MILILIFIVFVLSFQVLICKSKKDYIWFLITKTGKKMAAFIAKQMVGNQLKSVKGRIIIINYIQLFVIHVNSFWVFPYCL